MPTNKGGRPVGTPAELPSDVEIAEAADLWPIARVAEEQLGVPEEALIPFGRHMAKLDRSWLSTLEGAPPGKLVLVTAISPTPAGEGKTTTVVGLTDGLRHIGVRAAAALREPIYTYLLI
jgi:formate--tetrahydrofolate ligase